MLLLCAGAQPYMGNTEMFHSSSKKLHWNSLIMMKCSEYVLVPPNQNSDCMPGSGCLTIQDNEFPVDFQEEFQDITTALRPSVNDKLKKQVMIGSSPRLS
jgi:hypothetical protein